MKRFYIFWLLFFLVSCTGLKHEILTEDQQGELQSYYRDKQYFDLRDALQQYRDVSSLMLSFFKGVSDNRFNRLDTSIKHLKTFVRYWKEETNDSLLIDAYETLGDNYSKMFQYQKAAESYKDILEKFGDDLDAEHKADIENYIRMFSALTDVPPQTAEIFSDTKIQFVDGGYIPMKINGTDLQLGLDTGANYSFIMRSLAETTQMQIIHANADIYNVAGQIVKADLGVVSKMEIGNAVLRNVIFLVFEDKDLYIKQADYQIIGAIGFPVASSLKEVTFHQMDALSIPAAPRTFSHQNYCLDGLTPVVAGYYKGHRHAFYLDTGAGRSVLYIPFFREYEEELKAQCPLQSNRQQGLGGYRDIPAYIMKDAVLSFAGEEAVFHDLPVLTDVTTDDSHYFFGNIGRDLLHQFNTMTINFESMAVMFE